MKLKFVLAGLALAAASATQAANFSYVGNLSNPNEVLRFDFTLTGASDVTLRSYSYAGGVNAAGQTIARGGFDPILSVYNTLTGLRLDQNDDASSDSGVPADVDGLRYDVFLELEDLGPGSYTALLSQFDNFPGTELSDPFDGVSDRYTDFRNTRGEIRTSAWAFDVLGVNNATCAPNCNPDGGGNNGGGSGTVPVPGSALLVLLGGMLLGLSRITGKR